MTFENRQKSFLDLIFWHSVAFWGIWKNLKIRESRSKVGQGHRRVKKMCPEIFYYFSSSAVSSFAILRPCFLTVAFNFLISSSSSSIFNPSGSATAAATGAEFGTLLPFEICEARILNKFILRNLNKRFKLEWRLFFIGCQVCESNSSEAIRDIDSNSFGGPG